MVEAPKKDVQDKEIENAKPAAAQTQKKAE